MKSIALSGRPAEPLIGGSTTRQNRLPGGNINSLNADVKKKCKEGRLKEALHALDLTDKEGIRASFNTLVCLLRECSIVNAVADGRQVHSHMIKFGTRPNTFLANSLLSMYTKTGNLVDAQQLFDNILARDVFTWTILIAGYATYGHSIEALQLFSNMEHEGVKPNKVTFLSVLKACVSLEQGKEVHACIIEVGLQCDISVGSALLDMYSKCGSIEDASAVFSRLPKQDVVPWNTMIAGHVWHGFHKLALMVFWQLQQEGVKPDGVTLLSTLKACVSLGCFECGKKIHAYIIENEIEAIIVIDNTLVDMYAKCGSLVDARHMFNNMPRRDIVSWTVMISAYVQQGYGSEALQLVQRMQEDGTMPNKVTYIYALKACASLSTLEKGRQVHNDIVIDEYEANMVVGSAIIHMYSEHGKLEDARLVFDKMPKRDVVAWNTMIDGYTQFGQNEEALKLFWQVQCEDMNPDEATFLSTLKACANLGAVEQGQQVHTLIVKSVFSSDVLVGSAIIEMYAKGGFLKEARQIFYKMHERPVVVWSVMISGCIQNDCGKEALQLFHQMQLGEIIPNEIIIVSILKVCAGKSALEEGLQIHSLVIQHKFEPSVCIGNSLVDMYAKCGCISSARKIFDSMRSRDVVSFNAMIVGYFQNESWDEALEVFWKMQDEDANPDRISFVSALKACAGLATLEQGRHIYALAVKDALDSVDVVRGVLVDMYAKCGSITDARRVFDDMLKQDLVTWTVMISGYAQHGHCKESFQLFEQLQYEGMKVDQITFVGLFHACSHVGLVDECLCIFHSMHHGAITPISEHYACIVDLLSRAGRLDHAVDLIEKLPCQPTTIVWTALLGACRAYGDLAVAKCSAEHILELESENVVACVLLSNIYAACGNVDSM